MSELPLARLTSAIAVSNGDDLIIYVAGFTDGSGGRFFIDHNLQMIQPDPYRVYAADGNMGIIPANGLKGQRTSGAFVFPGNGKTAKIVLRCAPKETNETVVDLLEGDLIDGSITLEVVKAEVVKHTEAHRAIFGGEIPTPLGGEIPTPLETSRSE